MTTPELPPLPLKWITAKSPSGHVEVYRLFAGGMHLASVTKEGAFFQMCLRRFDDPMMRYQDVKFRILDNAKAAAELTVQTEWTNRVNQLYTPKP